MGGLVKGDVVVIHFPFSNLSQTKRRPALVLAALDGDDLILCQITSLAKADKHSVSLESGDFADGGLRRSSRIRPDKLFTADSGIVAYPRAGSQRRRLAKPSTA